MTPAKDWGDSKREDQQRRLTVKFVTLFEAAFYCGATPAPELKLNRGRRLPCSVRRFERRAKRGIRRVLPKFRAC